MARVSDPLKYFLKRMVQCSTVILFGGWGVGGCYSHPSHYKGGVLYVIPLKKVCGPRGKLNFNCIPTPVNPLLTLKEIYQGEK